VQLKQNNAVVYTVYNPQDNATFTVFDNDDEYTAVAVKGGMSSNPGIGKAGKTITLKTNTITVSFPSIKADYVQLKQNGALVYTVYNPQDKAEFKVFDNDVEYTAVAVKGGMSSNPGTGKAGETIILKTKTVTVSFPGIKADYVQLKQNGAVVYTVYNPQEEAKFIVFDNGVAYTASVIKGSISQPYTIS